VSKLDQLFLNLLLSTTFCSPSKGAISQVVPTKSGSKRSFSSFFLQANNANSMNNVLSNFICILDRYATKVIKKNQTLEIFKEKVVVFRE
jgi:hypothetical protein